MSVLCLSRACDAVLDVDTGSPADPLLAARALLDEAVVHLDDEHFSSRTGLVAQRDLAISRLTGIDYQIASLRRQRDALRAGLC